MNENKHEGRREPVPANLKSQTWTDWRRETVKSKPQFGSRLQLVSNLE